MCFVKATKTRSGSFVRIGLLNHIHSSGLLVGFDIV